MTVRRTSGVTLTAALVLGTGMMFGSTAAQDTAPATATARIQPVTANLRGAPPTGPHAVCGDAKWQTASRALR